MCRYAIRESSNKVKIFKNFKEKKSFKPELGAEGTTCTTVHCNNNNYYYINSYITIIILISIAIFGGQLLGVKASNTLSFYDWESLELIRRIEIAVKNVRQRYSTIHKGRQL